jgi:integrase
VSGSVKRRRRPGDPPGEASGPWQARYRAPDGRRYGRTFASKGQARAWLAAQETDAARGSWAKPNRATVADALDDWLASLDGRVALGDLRPSTAVRYRRVAETVRERIGRVKLADLSPVVVEDRLIGPLRQKGRASATVALVLVPLRLSLARARRAGLLLGDPLAAVDRRMLRVPDRGPGRTLSADEARRLVAAAATGRPRIALALALGSGVRIGELLGLTFADLGAESLEVRQAASGGKIGPPKTAAGRRVVPVLPEYRWALAQARALGADARPDRLVFVNGAGQPLHAGNVQRQWLRPAAQAAGLGPLGWHALRRSFVSRLAEAGVPVQLAAEVAGHSDPAITAKVYTDLTTDSGRAAIAAAIGAIGAVPDALPVEWSGDSRGDG